MVSNKIDNPKRDENDLIAGLKKGEEQAYRHLIRKYQAKLVNIAYGITLDMEESLDIVQDVFLKVFTGINRFEGKSTLYTWLRRITINESLNWIRRWKRRFRWQHQTIDSEEQGPLRELGSSETDPQRIYQKKELEKIIYNGLNMLPEKARSALILKELEGLSYDEIGSLLNIKKGTVSSRIFYAREKLREYLEDYKNGVGD